MWPFYEHVEARREALKQRLLTEAAARQAIRQQAVLRRSRRMKLLRAVMYRIGGWLRQWGENMQHQYREEPPADDVRWVNDQAGFNS